MRDAGNTSCPWITCVVAGALLALSGCHRTQAPVVATETDVASAQEQARKEVDQARVEARKDVKSAVKVTGATGGDDKNIAVARVTGAFDIAMAQADGDHKVALTKCKTLEPALQQPCNEQADAQFQAATAKAKAMRLAGKPHD